MISSPPYIFRQYTHDVPSLCQKAKRAQNIISAALPIISFCPAARTPLSMGLGALRSVSHLQEVIEGIRQRNFSKIAIGSVQLLLSLSALAWVISAIAIPHLNPSVGFLLWGVDDIIGNILEIARGIKSKNKKQILESLSQLITSLLYIAFISYGHIEILATCMLLQVIFNLHKALDEFKKGHYIEGTCHLITSALTLNQVIPQMKVIEWKWRKNPTLEGEICRDARGFVYVKVKDDIIFDLNKVFGDSSVPPYFGKNKYGAHITVIPVGELPKDTPIPEVGKTIRFNVAYCSSVKPEGFKGVNKVSFIGLSAPELDAMRSKYGLTPKVHDTHDYHITFGVNYES